MKRNLFLVVLSFFIFQNSNAQDFPVGGVNMINNAITNYSRSGSTGTISVISVEHTQFDKALKVNITLLPNNYWEFQLVFKPNMGLEINDICMVSFWARTTKSNSESGEGLLTAIIEHKDTYEKPLSQTFSPGGEWTHFYYGFKANADLSLDKIRAAMFLGHAIQTIEIANIQYLNYKKTISLEDIPVMAVKYAGMEMDAPWRTEAAERIEKFRKGNVNVKLVDAGNSPVANASVSIKMKKHQFGFGSAVAANTYLNNTTYRNHIHELFNEIVFENDLKWRPWVSRTNNSYILRALDSLSNNGIRVRGHCLIWPGWSYLPDFLKTYENDPERLKSECLDHIEETAGYTKGKLIDWDVMNEPYTNHVLQDIVGNSVMADWFKKAKEIDPDAKRFINDYSILSNGGVDVNHQNGYFDIIKYIDEEGGEIEGIGLQGHFAELVTGIPKLMEIIDRFAKLNKEIKITEFDINSTNDELKSNYTRDFMTAVFSHPQVKGILSWGFWASQHWKPEAAYYDADWTIRPQGEMYKSLVLDEWWTKDQSINSNETGISEFGSCFLGTYEVEVFVNGKTITKSVPVDFNLENNITLNVDDETIAVSGTVNEGTPVFTSNKKVSEVKTCELQIYPNPASSFLNLNIVGLDIENSEVQIFGPTGNSFFTKEIYSNSTRIELPTSISPGLYLLSLQSKTQRLVKRFVVQ